MKSMFDLCKTQISGKSKSNEEIELEKKLTALGYFQGATGGHLEFAVSHFQEANGLKPDGFAGPETQSMIDLHLTQIQGLSFLHQSNDMDKDQVKNL